MHSASERTSSGSNDFGVGLHRRNNPQKGTTVKSIFALLAAVVAAAALAQPAKPAAEPAAKPAAEAAKPEAQAATPAAQEAKPAAKHSARKATSRRHLDARHCLDKANNTEIIKCAEAYL
jgi:hypothetical protein